jgi:molybdate transport system substrate-binding protein
VVLSLLLACAAPPTVDIFAAASLGDVLPAALEGLDLPLRLNLGGSSRLARQIEAGAHGDLFISADARWMDWMASQGLIRPESRIDLASNGLVLIVPAGEEAPQDWSQLHPTRLALAGEEVPAGRYARAALEASGQAARLGPSLVSGDSVRVALAWVAAGHADAAIVYATDAAAEPEVQIAFPLDPSLHPAIRYPGAILGGADHPGDAARVLEHLAGSPAFAAHGFGPA